MLFEPGIALNYLTLLDEFIDFSLTLKIYAFLEAALTFFCYFLCVLNAKLGIIIIRALQC